MNFLWTLLLAFPGLEGNNSGETNPTGFSLSNEFRLNGKSTQAAFGIAKETALLTTAKLTRNDKLIAMGAIVSPSGHIITKASSCVGARLATLSNGESYKLKIKKRNEELDLAVYQMISDKDDFPFVLWSDDNATKTVSWVLSAFTELDEIRVGIKSAKASQNW